MTWEPIPQSLTMGTAPQSRLTLVFLRVQQLFALSGNATPLQFGKQYLPQNGPGVPPKYVVIQEPSGGRGEYAPPTMLGNDGSQIHAIDVFAFAKPTGSDIDWLEPAYAMMDLMVSALKRAGGWVKPVGRCEDVSTSQGTQWDCAIVGHFTYQREIVKNSAIWSVPGNIPVNAPQPANPPPGIPATSIELDVTIAPEAHP